MQQRQSIEQQPYQASRLQLRTSKASVTPKRFHQK